MTTADNSSSTNLYTHRNPYRRPSALGVPRKHEFDDSEYDKNFTGKSGEKQAASKTEDNLKYEGLNFAENTTNKTDYTELDGKRSDKSVPDDKLKYDGLSFDTGTENGEYKQYDSKRERYERKGDNLKQDGNLEKDTESKTRYKGEGGKRSEKINPNDKLNYDGLSFDKGTESGEYKKYDSKRERSEKKVDNLKQDGYLEKDTESGMKYRGEGGERSEKYNPDNKLNYDGLSFEKGTENGEYKRYDAKKERYEKRGDNLKQDGNLDKDTETGTRYQGKTGKRSEKYSPNNKLEYDGLSFEKGTENGSYPKHDTKKERYEKRGDNLRQDGDLEKDTETGTRYNGKSGERSEKYNPSNKLNSEGLSFEKGTENGEYRQYDAKRERYEKRGDNLQQNGDLEKDTETGTRYNGESGVRSEKYNPADKLNSEGLSFEKGTENGEYRQYDAKRERYEKKGDNLQQTGHLENDTETGTRYQGKSGKRPEKYNPNDKLDYDGLSFEKGTENGEYREYDAKKETYEKRKDTLRQDGKFEKDTEVGIRYRGDKGERAEIHAPDDKLYYDGLNFEKGTENSEFRGHNSKREIYQKKGDNLKPDGDLEKDTETGIRYRGEGGERSKRAKKADSLKPDGDIEKQTETGKTFTAKHGRRSTAAKRNEVLKSDGLEFKDGTENEKYSRNKPSKPQRYKMDGNLQRLEGDFEKDTETHDRYSVKNGRRRGLIKRSAYIKPTGLDFQKGSENSEYMKDMKVERPKKYTIKSNLQPSDGRLDGDSEQKDKYQARPGRRASNAKPKTAVKSTGLEFKNGTENNEYLRGMKPEKQARFKMDSNLKPLEGKIDDSTINQEYLKDMDIDVPARFISVNNLHLAKGDIAKLSEYTGRYDTAARKGTSRAKFKLKQELTTPYGNLAGSAIRLGDRRRYNAAAVSV